MRTLSCLPLALAVCFSNRSVIAEEVTIHAPIVSIGMFKNGVAVVKRLVEVPGPGTYILTNVPASVHGTFWIESDAQVQTRVTQRDIEVPQSRSEPAVNFQKELAGREVSIRLREPGLEPITGVVVEVAREQQLWERNYETTSGYPNTSSSYGWPSSSSQPQSMRYLAIETQSGLTYVESSMISSLEVKGQIADTIMRRQPVLLFKVESSKKDSSSATIAISYLAKGIAWAPSYKIDAADSGALHIQQQAVIKNELEEFGDAELVLISGFPNIEFSHVTSPLFIPNSLASFFAQLGRTEQLRHSSRGDVVTQQAVMGNLSWGDEVDGMSVIPEGEGVDLHFHSIGRQTMDLGDALMLTVASGQSPYQRIVEWIVPDHRDAHGNPVRESERKRYADGDDGTPWDALRFRNPLPFAMTTAPAMTVTGDRFNGQRTIHWTNRGEQTTLRVTKSLSIRTRTGEWEEEGQREIINYGGNKYRKTPVSGELVVSNHRKEPVDVIIRKRFSGELVEVDRDSKTRFLEEGAYSVNRRNELIWSVTLQPGEEQTLTYRYTILVKH